MSSEQETNSAQAGASEESVETVDFAIVGGGVSGAYCAWRLASYAAETGEARKENSVLSGLGVDGGRLKVCLYESGDRVGGRLDSQTPPGMPNLRAEMGGMRYLTTQLLVSSLVRELQLASREFQMGDENNLLYLRRRHFRVSDFSRPERVPYQLEWNEVGKSPVDLMMHAIRSVIPDAEKLSPWEWDEVKRTRTVYGNRLHDIGFWNLLYYILSSEAYNLILDAGGYHSILSNWNAGQAMEWFLADFPPEAEYRTLVKGFQQLPLTLARKFEEKGGRLHMRHRLKSFDVPSDQRDPVRLYFDDGTGRERQVRARHLILAMPRRSLELLQKNELLRSVEPLIKSVRAQPASKLFIGYEFPWWRVLGLRSGRSVTDLPIRQTFYFGTECEQPEAHCRNHNSLLMASYHDGPAVGFWKGLAGEQGQTAPGGKELFGDKTGNRFVGGGESSVPGYEATKDVVSAAHYQLKQMHGVEYYIPKPYMALYKDWGEDPFGGGWHFWKLNVRPWEVMKKMRRPAENANVYICGEAYSNNQGWVEGALTSAELLLNRIFGMRRPAWLPEDYYLGPSE